MSWRGNTSVVERSRVVCAAWRSKLFWNHLFALLLWLKVCLAAPLPPRPSWLKQWPLPPLAQTWVPSPLPLTALLLNACYLQLPQRDRELWTPRLVECDPLSRFVPTGLGSHCTTTVAVLLTRDASRLLNLAPPLKLQAESSAHPLHVISPLQPLTLSVAAHTQGHTLQVGV